MRLVLAAALLSASGCTLDRAPLVDFDAAGVDVPRRDTGGRDVPNDVSVDVTACDPMRCDDGNVCTDDTCGPAGACEHTNNGAACDDGLFCTGNDRCQAGACTMNDGPPCPSCIEATRSCGSCATAAECPGGGLPIEGACTFADTCSIVGSRTVTTYACAGGTCTASTSPGTCTRTTNGTSCGTTTVVPGSCISLGGPCGDSGIQTDVTTSYVCAGGVCNASSMFDTTVCTYDPVGDSCSGCTPPSMCERSAFGGCTGTAGTECGTGTCSAPSVCEVTGGTPTTMPCVMPSGSTCGSLTCGACTNTPGPGCTRPCNGSLGMCNAAGICDGTPMMFDQPCTCP